MESFTKEEGQLLQYIGYIVLSDDRLSKKILAEVQDEYETDESTADSLFEKLEELID